MDISYSIIVIHKSIMDVHNSQYLLISIMQLWIFIMQLLIFIHVIALRGGHNYSLKLQHLQPYLPIIQSLLLLLHFVFFWRTWKKLQVKYNSATGNIFTPDIGLPQGDCASPIWFIFYLHKAISAAKVNFETPRNILLDVKHDHTDVNKDSFKSDIEKDHSYSKSILSKGNYGFLIEQQYADDATWRLT